MINPLLEFLAQVRPIHALLLVVGPYVLFSLIEYINARKLPRLKLIVSSGLYSIFLLSVWFLFYAFWNTIEVSRFEPFDLCGSIFLATIIVMAALILQVVMDRPKDFSPVLLVMCLVIAAMFSVLLPVLMRVILWVRA